MTKSSKDRLPGTIDISPYPDGTWIIRNIRQLSIKAYRIIIGLLIHIGPIGRYRPPNGNFLAYRLLDEAQNKGKIVTASQQPRSKNKDSICDLAKLGQHAAEPWPIFWLRASNASLIGDSLIWRNSKDQICLEQCYGFELEMSIRNSKFIRNSFLENATLLNGSTTSLLTNWTQGTNYYHWIVDALPRISMLEYAPSDTRIIIPSAGAGFVDESMELLDLGDRCIKIESNHVICENFYFMSPTAQVGHWNPYAYSWLQNVFKKHFSKEIPNRRIFFTRRGNRRVPKNIRLIEKLFKKNGFDIIDCGAHPLLQQIQISSSAICVAGIHGAAMTNLLWTPHGIPILEIFESNYLNACYENISIHNSSNYAYIFHDFVDAPQRIEAWISSVCQN